MYGCQCPKRLWLHKHMPELRDEEAAAQTAIFQQGTDVGLLAQQLFPGGEDASPVDTYSYQQSVADTTRYIAEGHNIIYEAAFQYEGVLCAVDMLVKEDDGWVAYEVKSSCSVKPAFINDASLQYFVITNAGLTLKDFCIVHLNNQYIRHGNLDVNKLFCIASVLPELLPLQPTVLQKVAELKALVSQKDMPLVGMGKHCDNPYACNFQTYCSKDLEPELPDYGEAQLDEEALQAFTNSLVYPLYFMDFETWMAAVPAYDGQWPYRQMNFQYSVHVQHSPGAALQEHAYLAEGPHSPQLEFISNLLDVLGTEGSIVVYNKAFENTRLKELKNDFPDHEPAISAVQDRLVDLMVPFRRKEYYLPGMKGSYSIKNVLPALVPELCYDNLAIGNGGDASAAFYNLKDETDLVKIATVRKDLLEYCGLDTLAMVKILEKIRNI